MTLPFYCASSEEASADDDVAAAATRIPSDDAEGLAGVSAPATVHNNILSQHTSHNNTYVQIHALLFGNKNHAIMVHLASRFSFCNLQFNTCIAVSFPFITF